jgi:hypothetical protein
MKVWIELPVPESPDEAAELERQSRALLARLDCAGLSFSWSPRDSRWLLVQDSSGAYWTLTDNGHWFDMSLMGLETA